MTEAPDGTRERRLRRIRELSNELHEQCQRNPYPSREACLRIVEELISLLDADDAHQRAPLPPDGRS